MEKQEDAMDRRTANKEWRDVTRGAPDGVSPGRTMHEFAQRVEALTIAGWLQRHVAEMARLRIDAKRLRAALLVGHTYAECCPTPASPDDRDADCPACAALGPNV